MTSARWRHACVGKGFATLGRGRPSPHAEADEFFEPVRIGGAIEPDRQQHGLWKKVPDGILVERGIAERFVNHSLKEKAVKVWPPCGFLAIMGTALLLTGCSSGQEMHTRGLTAPTAESEVRLAGADVKIGDISVKDTTISPGSGTSTLFTVTLADPADGSRLARMQMDYPVHSMMGMMGDVSSADCYDDGTHGDSIAGDGTYSYMDVGGHIGPHLEDCPTGEYLYTFHGTDLMGMPTNSVECLVTVQ